MNRLAWLSHDPPTQAGARHLHHAPADARLTSVVTLIGLPGRHEPNSGGAPGWGSMALFFGEDVNAFLLYLPFGCAMIRDGQ